MMFIFFSLGLLFTLPLTANAAEFSRPGWVVVKECCPAAHISVAEAQMRAMEAARRTAVERVTGVDIRAMSLTEDFRLLGDYIESAARGVVARDTLLNLWSESVRRGEALVVEVWVEMACSVAVTPVKVSTLNLRVALDKTVYADGETMRLQVRPSEDCYLYIFGLWGDGSLAALFPNELLKTVRVKGGETFSVPDDKDNLLSQMKLQAALLPGGGETVEYIKVVATRKERPFIGGIGEDALQEAEIAPGVKASLIRNREAAQREFFRWFLSLPPEETAVEQALYRVIR